MATKHNFAKIKEAYYTHDTIDAQAHLFLDEVKTLKKQHVIPILSEKTVLLIIDMQGFFFHPHSHAYIPSMPAILPKIKILQDHFLTRGLLTIQTQHKNRDEDNSPMGKWWKSTFCDTDPSLQIITDLQNNDVTILQKTEYDAFWKTNLASQLKDKGISQVIITGVMTHLCCETTARSAFIHGFDVFFTIDATATYNRMFHSASLLNLSHGFAVPVITQEILDSIK